MSSSLSQIWVLLNDCCIHLIQKSWRNKKKRLWISQVYTIDNSKLDHLSKANFRVETKSSLMLNTRVHVGGETITYVLELMEEDDWDRIYSLNLLANMAPSTSNIIHGRVTGVQEQWKCSLQTSGSTDKRLNACPRVLALFLVEILTHLHGLNSWKLHYCKGVIASLPFWMDNNRNSSRFWPWIIHVSESSRP